MNQEIEYYIKSLEEINELDPNCSTCKREFYPAIQNGALYNNIFAPRHKASDRCESGKHKHCSCDICF